jgi:murein hydrolase activator
MRVTRPNQHNTRMARLTACTMLAGCVALTPTQAQQPDPQIQLQATREKLEAEARRAQALKSEAAEKGEALRSVAREYEDLTKQLQETAKLVQRSEAQLTSLEARGDELEVEQRTIEASLAARQDSIGKLLGAMQRMGRNPPPVIITKREDALQMVRSAMLLAKAFPEMRSQYEDLAKRLTNLARVMADIKTERDKLAGEKERFKVAKLRLDQLMDSKRQTLAERQDQLESVKKAAGDISRNVEELADLIGKLDKAVADRTTLGAYDREIAKVDLDKVPAAPPVAEPKVAAPPAAKTPAAEPEKKVAVLTVPKAGPTFQLEPRSGASGTVNPMQPKIPFHLAKAQLPLPAQGRRVITYGDKLPSGKTSSGIVIETRHGAQITSPCDGWVIYASEFRSYGQVLIINGGGGYHVVLTNLSQIDVQVGQFVLVGEPIGTMSAAPKGRVQGNAPVLYVEFRKEGKPVDPEPWWSEGQKKVQG